MRSFNKSIMYSGSIACVALVVMFMVYDVITTQSATSVLSNIAPAAGESTFGDAFTEKLENADIVDMSSSTSYIMNDQGQVIDIEDALHKIGTSAHMTSHNGAH